jgi:predicted peptidase
MAEAVKAAGGNIQYTEFEGVDHNSWDPAYQSEETIAWILKQKKE